MVMRNSTVDAVRRDGLIASRRSTGRVFVPMCAVPSLFFDVLHSPRCNRIALGERVIGNESAPIQLAQCRFPGLSISNAKILIYF